MSCLLYQVELKLQKDAPNFEQYGKTKKVAYSFKSRTEIENNTELLSECSTR